MESIIMRFAIVIVLAVLSSSCTSEDEIFGEYVDYTMEYNRKSGDSDNAYMACVLSAVYKHYDDEDKEYIRKMLAYRRDNPDVSIKRIDNEASALYDKSGEIAASMKEKVELAKRETDTFRECY